MLSWFSTKALAQETLGTVRTSVSRLRLGASVGLGIGSFGLAGAASARAGVQITPSWAASLQATAAETGEIFGGDNDNWRSYAVLIEWVLPGRMVVLGGGPALATGTRSFQCPGFFNDCGRPTTSEGYVSPGFDGRLAVTFGANRPTIRGGFTLEAAVHASPHSVLLTGGIGFDIF